MEEELPGRKTSQVLRQFAPWESKAIVRYLHIQEIDPLEIHKLLTAACGGHAPTYKDVRSWIQDFIENKEDPSMLAIGSKNSIAETTTDPALVARIELLLTLDRRISLERLAEMSMVTVNDVQAVVTNVLGLKRVCERWVPRLWTPEQRDFRLSICSELSEMLLMEGPSLFSRLIVGCEAFAGYYSGSNNYTTPSRKPSMNPGEKFKPTVEDKRVHYYVFYDARGLIAADMLHSSEPPTPEEYADILKNSVYPALKKKRSNYKEYVLMHDVTPVHSSYEVQKALKDLRLSTLPHAPASPDLEPHEYWLYKHLCKQINGRQFKSRADLWASIDRALLSITPIEFQRSLNKLGERWNIVLEKTGLYLL